MRIYIAILTCFSSSLFSQSNDWINEPHDQWPLIALINEVWYTTGERYIHPSFEYAATGFLIDTGEDTLAVTAKHVLWIAKTTTMNAVDLQGKLDRWVMHPKGSVEDSVVIGKLINEDPEEFLNGPESTITQRDWIVFTTSYVSPKVQPLKPRYAEIVPGEKVYYAGCPYNDEQCIISTGTVLEVEGNRIVFSKMAGTNIAGASGSPIFDEKGMLVGILGGAATAKSTGEDALYGTSTHYLKRILTNKKPLNVPLISVGKPLNAVLESKGLDAALSEFKTLKADERNFFIYDFSPEKINVFAKSLVEKDQLNNAIAFFKLSLNELPVSGTYTEIGRVYLMKGEKDKAKASFEKALELWPENEEAQAALKETEN